MMGKGSEWNLQNELYVALKEDSKVGQIENSTRPASNWELSLLQFGSRENIWIHFTPGMSIVDAQWCKNSGTSY